MNLEYADILRELHSKLDNKRYIHTLGVAHTAACLYMSIGKDPDKAYLAGLLHDCAKYMKGEEFISYCSSHAIDITDVERDNPALLHSKVGADMALREYGVKDEGILSAIRWHTTGHPDMNDLESVVFIADYIEPNRTHDPELKIIRQEAFDNQTKAIYHIYKNTMEHLKTSAKTLDPMTEDAYKYYKSRIMRG